ncbi:glutamate racemase [Methylocystis sp. SC2]|uniref:glutamate racemase n=1 Tax=Methylocystis sp. (strain SC2) TaxID=187303 RepID=UPI00027AE969|nr:glutamate racemase [Methylocystis sp. SC2]CCJ07962.1 Glutamate racemase [Methylocystis sp. SC2]
MTRPPKLLIFDSGLGGLTVFAETVKLRPHADYLYCADDAGFPYGSWKEPELVERVMELMERLIAEHAPDIVVIACNTASTIVLHSLRVHWPALPFVGTVPAIKPAAERTRSKMISVLGTQGTVARDYTQNLIAQFAAHCSVTLVGSKRLASLAESYMHGESVRDADIGAEIAPCFQEEGGRRTDAVVLACTHYPLLVDEFKRLAPWPVEWIDPAPAIARRADQLLGERFGPDAAGDRQGSRCANFTSGVRPLAPLAATLGRYGLAWAAVAPTV